MHKNSENAPRGFNKAKEKARELLQDGSRTRTLVDKAIKKAKSHRKDISKFSDDLKTLQRLVGAYVSGDYRSVSVNTLLYALAAIIYFVNPFDVIPDFIAGLGFIDDAGIIAFVIKNIRGELQKFEEWEQTRPIDEEHLGI